MAAPKGAIFISYRRDEAQGWATHLHTDLSETLSGRRVFYAPQSILGGELFAHSIRRELEACSVALVLIGPRWLVVTDDRGNRRIDDPEDWVHVEVVESLKRPGLRVVPVLLGGARMPTEAELPEALKHLAGRQAHEVTDKRWEFDVGQLVAMLRGPRHLRGPLIAAGIALTFAALVGYLTFGERLKPEPPSNVDSPHRSPPAATVPPAAPGPMRQSQLPRTQAEAKGPSGSRPEGTKPNAATEAPVATPPAGSAPAGSPSSSSRASRTPVAPPAPVVPPRYRNPEIVANILQGELDAVPFGEYYAKSYVAQMAQHISEACQGAPLTRRQVDDLRRDARLKTMDASPDGGLRTLYGTFMTFADMKVDPAATATLNSRLAGDMNALPEEAKADATTLLTQHPCGSDGLDNFARHLTAYINNEGAPRLSTGQLVMLCVDKARPTGRYRGRDFCECFVATVEGAPISRAERRRLSTDFWEAAQQLMSGDVVRYRRCVVGYPPQ
jgi:TIR domain